MASLKGGPELRARLASVAASGPAIQKEWAVQAAVRIAADAPTRTGRLKRSIKAGQKSGKAAVLGNWYGIILDRGTKAYTIEPKNAESLKYTYRGRTIFSKKSNRKRLRRRPFITKGAQEALKVAAVHPDQVILAWNRKRRGGRFTRLAL